MISGGDFAKIRTALSEQGFDVQRTGSGHFKVRGKDQRLATFAEGTNPRSLKNALADLRRIGFVWPPPEKSGNGQALALENCPLCGQGTWDPNLGDCVNSECKEHLGVKEPSARPPSPPGGLDLAFAKVKALREDLRVAKVDVDETERELARVQRALDGYRDLHAQIMADYVRRKAELEKLLDV